MTRRLLSLALFISLSVSVLSQEQEDPKSFDITEIGQQVPEFSFTTLEGKTINIMDLKGKTVLINFFATWCPPCMKEMPELQKKVWNQFKDREFYMVSLGRGHDAEVLKKFQAKKGFTFPIAPDKDKSIYELFFSKYIPRNVLINAEGEIILQEFGYTEEDFAHIISLIDKETR